MNPDSILIIVSGFSGAGKGTLMKELVSRYPETYALSVSATTREPRPGEVHGREYFFIEQTEFEKMIEKGALIEYATYCKSYYGTPRSYVDEQLESGKDVILEIEIQGALQVKKDHPDALLLFVTPPTIDILLQRLVDRGTESLEAIQSRMHRAYEEAQGMELYDYLIINDELYACVNQMHEIIQSEHYRCSRNHDYVEKLKKDLLLIRYQEEMK